MKTVDQWIESRALVERIPGPRKTYRIADLDKLDRVVHFLGNHIAFNKEAWIEGND